MGRVSSDCKRLGNVELICDSSDPDNVPTDLVYVACYAI